MTFTEIASRLRDGNLTPDEIKDFRSYCAGMLYRMYEEYGRALSFGAEWVTENRKNHGSQAETERAYLSTEAGKKETTLKYEIRGVEAMSEVLTSLHFQTNREMQLASRE